MLRQQLKVAILLLVGLLLLLFLAYELPRFSYARSIGNIFYNPSEIVTNEGVPGTQWMNLQLPGNASAGQAAAASRSSSSPTAKFVHQSWKTKDLPARFVRWFSTWDICFPNYEHRLWTDEDNLKLVSDKAPEFLAQYTQFKDNIQRADAVRYLYMYHYGGIYSDLDNECLRSFQYLIDNSGCGVILGSMRSNRHKQYIQNSFMYSRPGHPFWLKVIDAMKERKEMVGAYSQDTVDLTTGPKLLMHVVAKYRKVYEGTTTPGPICVFPDTYFNPYSWDLDKNGPCKDLNKMSETDLALCKIKHKMAYVIQYHTQSWLAGKV